MSPILINLNLEKVVREMDSQPQEELKLQESAVVALAYTDDVVLMSKSFNNLKSLFIRLEEMAKNVELQVNEEKPEYMVMERRDSVITFPYLKDGRYEFNRAK